MKPTNLSKVRHINTYFINYLCITELRQRLFRQDVAPPPFVAENSNTSAVQPIVVDKFLVPYDENPHFVGRKELLKNLRKRLCEVESRQYKHRIALYGLGGVGKTQTALAYVYLHRSDYDAIYWITAVNQASVLSGFQDIARASGLLKTSVDIVPTDVAKTVLSWLRAQDNWLLIIDNLDDYSAVEGFLPHRESGKHTIITTRNPNVYEIPSEGIEVDVLDPQDATELLILRSNVSSKADSAQIQAEAEKIVKELGYLALAIEQAAAFIRETSRNFFRFLPSYRADRKMHHARIPRGHWEYSKAVGTTWHLSFQQVKQNNAQASELLGILAFLNPDGILLEFLVRGKRGLPDHLKDLIAETDGLYSALSELERFSLIRRQDEGEELITIHRLVQCVIKDDMEDDIFSSVAGWVIDLCDHAFPLRWDNELRLLCRKFQEQVVVTLSDIKTANSEALVRVLTRVGTFLHEDGKYEQADELRLKVVDILTMLCGSEHPNTLRAVAQLAETYRCRGRLDKAIELQEKILEMSIKVLGENHVDTETAMGDLAASYRGTGRNEEAVKIQEKVLDSRMKTLGDEHPETLTAMGNLGATYRNQRRLRAAVQLQDKVYKTRLRKLGEDNPDTLRAMANVAVTHRFLQDPQLSAKLEEIVLSKRFKTLGIEHPHTLDIMRNLAASYQVLRRWDDACKLQKMVLEMRTRTVGEDHPDTIWAMVNLADTYHSQLNFGDAVKLLEKALEIRRRELGNDHRHTLIVIDKLVRTYFSQGRHTEAENLKAELVHVRERGTNVDGQAE